MVIFQRSPRFNLTNYNLYGIYETYGSYNKYHNPSHQKKSAMVRRTYNKGKMISAKEITQAFNVTYQTVNHYTDFGLLPILAKIGNVRMYDRGVVGKRMRQIRELANEGYSLRLIRKRLIGV